MSSLRTLVTFALVSLVTGLCNAADRVALVIGNSKYESSPLRNPTHDADAMTKALSLLGFQVNKHKDLNLRGMKDAVVQFSRQVPEGSLGLFYFAGHGIQVKGENFLVPIGAKIREEYEVEHECLPVGLVLGAMENSDGNLNVLILDCCRDNPFTRSWRRSVSTGGLAAISKIPEGTVIAFSTAPGKVAADGKGEHSPFTKHLTAVLNSRPTAGLELVDVFRSTGRAVKKETGQVPWMNQDLSIEDYYLWRGVGSGLAAMPRAPRIHVLLVGNTDDPATGRTTQHDIKGIASAFGQNVSAGQLDMNVLSAEQATTPDNIMRVIRDDIKANAHDTFVYYYSGPGRCDDSGELHFEFRVSQGRRSLLRRSDVTRGIRQKGMRLAVVISDASAVELPTESTEVWKAPGDNTRPSPPGKLEVGKSSGSPMSQLFQSLFVRARGVVEINGCSRGEGGYGSDGRGIFTNSLLDTMLELRDQNVSWKETVDSVRFKTAARFRALRAGLERREIMIHQQSQDVWAELRLQ